MRDKFVFEQGISDRGKDIIEVYKDYYNAALNGAEDENILQKMKLDFLYNQMDSVLYSETIGLSIEDFEKAVVKSKKVMKNESDMVDDMVVYVTEVLEGIEKDKIEKGLPFVECSVYRRNNYAVIVRYVGYSRQELCSECGIAFVFMPKEELIEFTKFTEHYVKYKVRPALQNNIENLKKEGSMKESMRNKLFVGDVHKEDDSWFYYVPVFFGFVAEDCLKSDIEKAYEFLEQYATISSLSL